MAKLVDQAHANIVPAADKRRSFHRTNLTGWLFASPWALGLLCFYAVPILMSIYFSFTTYSILQPGEYVGLTNYIDLFCDPLFWKSMCLFPYSLTIFHRRHSGRFLEKSSKRVRGFIPYLCAYFRNLQLVFLEQIFSFIDSSFIDVLR